MRCRAFKKNVGGTKCRSRQLLPRGRCSASSAMEPFLGTGRRKSSCFRAATVEFGINLMMGLDLLCYYDHRIETDRRKKAGVTIL